eukprot:TRINITY_DN113878_c0_g1_i1.p2 TRINITY_DN113878_c0_g1~~TRINITY_DN113878_c0_g1_i1.p2  ORF type:complete len:104 (+),score=18.68 TRINITY_DN113878_c0_g1_i1:40-312(+)
MGIRRVGNAPASRHVAVNVLGCPRRNRGSFTPRSAPTGGAHPVGDTSRAVEPLTKKRHLQDDTDVKDCKSSQSASETEDEVKLSKRRKPE